MSDFHPSDRVLVFTAFGEISGVIEGEVGVDLFRVRLDGDSQPVIILVRMLRWVTLQIVMNPEIESDVWIPPSSSRFPSNPLSRHAPDKGNNYP